ncbi:hypothetical protein BgiBS90_012254 [Biomphalaria glabrata]|nr:hypothetical protein BgiBS90_012254 [Biomphalaria glabrata]
MYLTFSYRRMIQILAFIVTLRLQEMLNMTVLAENITDPPGLLIEVINHPRGSIVEGTKPGSLARNTKDKPRSLGSHRNDKAESLFKSYEKDKPESLFESTKGKPGSLLIRSKDKLGALVDSREDKLGALVDSREDKLGALVDSREDKLGALVDSREEKLGALVDSREDKLGALVDSREEKLGALVESITNKPISKGDNVSSCQKCGRSLSLPCSCDVICQVYHNCCEDFVKECASTILKFENSYEDYKDSLIECSNDNVYVIASCPKQRVKIKSESKRIKRDTAKDLKTTGQMKWTLKDIWRNMPVTDRSSRLVFKNKSISDCYPHNPIYLFLWNALLDYLEVTESEHHYLIDLSATYAPQFETPLGNNSFYEPHQCISHSIGDCRISKYKDLCLSFTSYVRAENMLVYDNVYCAQCAGLNDTSLLMPVTSVGSGSRPKITMSSSVTYDIVTFQTDDTSDNQKWHFLECSLDQKSQNQLKCIITACNSLYYKLHAGQCLSLSVLSVAFFNLGVTPLSDRPMISAYIMCLLKYYADFILVGEWRPAQIFFYPQVYFLSNFLFYPSTDSIEILDMHINRYNLLRLISISKMLKYSLGLTSDRNEAYTFVEDFEEIQTDLQYELLFVRGSLENVSIDVEDGSNSTTMCLCVVPMEKAESISFNDKQICDYTCIVTSSSNVPVNYDSMCLLNQDFHLNSFKRLQTDILTSLLFALICFV